MGQPAELGEHLGGYVLEKVLGQGGMGCVYLGTHHLLGRKAAIKVLDSALASDAQFVSRFFHEAKIVNDIRHPNVVDIVDFIQTTDPVRVAYVMEFIEGSAVNEALRERRFTPVQAVNITSQVVQALEAVHATGVIHRDLKPGNILLAANLEEAFDRPNTVKVLDFGIAKSSNSDAKHRTSTGALLGTPAYMAPEQVAGDPVSAATDVYGVGEILYELLFGEPLFQGENIKILRTKLGDKTPSIPTPVDQPHAADLTQLIRRCLDPDPKQRATLSYVRAELERIRDALAFEPTVSGPWPSPSAGAEGAAAFVDLNASSTYAQSVAIRSQISRVWLGAAGVVLFALAGMIVVLATQDRRPVIVPIETSAPEPTKTTAPEAVPDPPTPEKKVAVTSIPSGATVRDGDQELGKTPLEVAVKTDQTRELSIELEGMIARTITLTAQSEPTEVKLKPRRARDRRGQRRKGRRRRQPPPAPAATKTLPTPTTPVIETEVQVTAPADPPSKPEDDNATKSAIGSLKVEAWTTAGRQVPAQVQVDGRKVKKTTPFTVKARSGKKQIVVTAPGYPPRKRTVTVTGGKETLVQVVVDLE